MGLWLSNQNQNKGKEMRNATNKEVTKKIKLYLWNAVSSQEAAMSGHLAKKANNNSPFYLPIFDGKQLFSNSISEMKFNKRFQYVKFMVQDIIELRM